MTATHIIAALAIAAFAFLIALHVMWDTFIRDARRNKPAYLDKRWSARHYRNAKEMLRMYYDVRGWFPLLSADACAKKIGARLSMIENHEVGGPAMDRVVIRAVPLYNKAKDDVT